jgi:hypothetical protein
MRFTIVLFQFALFGIFTSNQAQACTATSQYPANIVVTDSTSLAAVTITTCNYGGEYAVVILSGSFTYTFESSVATDYLEITNTSNTTLIYGTGSVSYNNSGINTVRMHIFTDSSCGTQNTCRVTTVTRDPCIATVQFPTYVDTANSNYDTHFVSNCNYAGQFYEIYLTGGQYEISSSNTSDIFVFTDTANNLFFSQQTPVITTITTTTFLVIRVHIFSNTSCGAESSCRTTAVRRLPCIAATQYPNYTVQTSNDPAPDYITNCNYAGDYVQIDVSGGETYEMTSDSADWFFLTLTDNTYLSSGQTPFTFINPYGDTTMRVHIFRDSACGELSACRQTYIQCTTCPVPPPSISSSASVACLAELPITLTADSAFVGQVYWYSGSCNSTPIDSGISIQVSPSSSTTYFCANSFEGTLSVCDSMFLEVYPSPAVSIGSVQDILCNGETTGSAVATGSAGLSPYAFLWSNGEDSTLVDGLGAGWFTVTLTDANGCSAFDTVQINEPSPIQDSLFYQANPLCNSDLTGALGVIISGGTTPYTYNWSTTESTSSITNLGHGTYTLTLTDNNGCEEVYSYDVVAPDALVNNMTTYNVWCEGDSNGVITTSVNGGVLPYSYNWSNSTITSGQTNVAEGNYYLTVTDSNSCVVYDTAIVGHTNTNPTIEMDSADIICAGKSLVLDAGAGFVYKWSTSKATQTIEVDTAGAYTVTVTDFNGCESAHTIIIVADSCLGINSLSLNTALSLFPNPTSGLLQFELSKSIAEPFEITIVSALGKVVQTKICTSNNQNEQHYLDLSQLAKGVYLVQFQFKDEMVSRSVIIQ